MYHIDLSLSATHSLIPSHILTRVSTLNPRVDTPLFATTGNPLQLYHSPRAKILAFTWVLLYWVSWVAGVANNKALSRMYFFISYLICAPHLYSTAAQFKQLKQPVKKYRLRDTLHMLCCDWGGIVLYTHIRAVLSLWLMHTRTSFHITPTYTCHTLTHIHVHTYFFPHFTHIHVPYAHSHSCMHILLPTLHPHTRAILLLTFMCAHTSSHTTPTYTCTLHPHTLSHTLPHYNLFLLTSIYI